MTTLLSTANSVLGQECSFLRMLFGAYADLSFHGSSSHFDPFAALTFCCFCAPQYLGLRSEPVVQGESVNPVSLLTCQSPYADWSILDRLVCFAPGIVRLCRAFMNGGAHCLLAQKNIGIGPSHRQWTFRTSRNVLSPRAVAAEAAAHSPECKRSNRFLPTSL